MGWDSVDFDKVINILTNSTENFRKSRNNFIQKCIETVLKQCHRNGKSFIDSMIREGTMLKSEICLQCGYESHTSYRICRSIIDDVQCGGKLTSSKLDEPDQLPATDINPYESFNFAETLTPGTNCTTGEPDFLNPNSYQNIINVIQNICSREGVKQYGGTKEWIFVKCDGLPYKIISDIIANV